MTWLVASVAVETGIPPQYIMEDSHMLKALLAVPADLPNAELRRGLEALANEMMVDIELDEGSTG